MRNTMMPFPLTLAHILGRAGKLFVQSEIVSCLPDKSPHRHRYGDFHRRALALGGTLQALGQTVRTVQGLTLAVKIRTAIV